MIKAKNTRFLLLSGFLFILIAVFFAFLLLRGKKEDIIPINNEWFYVINSSVQKNFTGIKSNEDGYWRIVNGKVDFDANGLVDYDSELYYVVNGKVDLDAHGLVKIGSDMWFLNDGIVDQSFSGISEYDTLSWRVDSGHVDTGFSGLYTFNDSSYNIVKGMVSMHFEDVYVSGHDGFNLYGFVYKPAVYNGKTMIFCHGIGDTAERGKELAHSLALNGYTVFGFDFSGGGAYSRSEGSTTDMSVLTEYSDLEYIFDYVASQPYVNEDSIYLAGHSQGGIVSGLFAANNPSRVRALILYAPGFVVCQNWAPSSEWDIPEEEVYMDNDMFVGTRYYQDLYELLGGDGDRIYSLMAPYDGPVLMLHGTDDIVTSIYYTREMCDYYSNETLIEYSGADHCFTGDEYQELLANDTLEFLNNN